MRLDQALVERGLCPSREKASRAVMAGQVRVNGQPARKSSDTIRPADAIELLAAEKFVSRGGHKLEHALQHFALDVTGLTAIDLGASTGGFTDCLLQSGVTQVYAVDVGQGQLAWKLRQDPRVVVMEKTNARNLSREMLFGGARHSVRAAGSTGAEERCARSDAPYPPIDLAVIDCSFISLTKILPAALGLVRVAGRIVALIKPQFEAGKAEVDKGAGVIRDAAIHRRVIQELQDFVSTIDGAQWLGVTESPVLGPAGNKEFLALIEKTR